VEILDVTVSPPRSLPESIRIRVAREAVHGLGIRIEKIPNFRNALAEVQNARRLSNVSDPHVNESLKVLEARLEHRSRVQDLKDTLKRVQHLGETGEWPRVAERAKEALQKGEATDRLRPALEEIGKLGETEAVLQRVQSALQSPARDRPAQAVRAWREVKTERLSAPLREAARGLRAVAELRDALERPWASTPNVEGLSKSLADFQTVSGNKELTARIGQELAVKAFLEGFCQEARSLLPKDGPSDHARNLLRDMKALALGEGNKGNVRTDPAEQALATGTENGQPPKPPRWR
jgi:hypothetical protein